MIVNKLYLHFNPCGTQSQKSNDNHYNTNNKNKANKTIELSIRKHQKFSRRDRTKSYR